MQQILDPGILRVAVRADVPAIQRIRGAVRENRLTSRTISDAEVIEALERTGRGWVVESNGVIVGFAIGDSTEGSIWALFVDPEHDRRGVGRCLHDAMVAWLWQQGHNRLWLSTEPGTRAETFYRRAGWQDMGLLPSGERRFELTRSADRT